MSPFRDQVAVIAGASGAIGGAIAHRLAAGGATLLLLGRDPGRLEARLAQVRESSPRSEALVIDLTLEEPLPPLRGRLESLDGVDILVHAQGFFAAGALAEAAWSEIEQLFAVNVYSALRLTRLCLPSLVERQGQIAFINSTAGLRAAADVGAYAASKHALRAVADSLREEVNRQGVRVLSVFPGRIASSMQEEVCRLLDEPYEPERLMQPTDVAAMVVEALRTPYSAEVTEIRMRPMRGG